MTSREWLGDNPYYLLFVGDSASVTVDLDEHGWIAMYGHIFRMEGELYLVRKSDEGIVMSVHQDHGDQGYYTARHIGTVSGGGSQREVVAYGIGKKRADGNQDNLWILPWGQYCVGNDVEYFAIMGLKIGLN